MDGAGRDATYIKSCAFLLMAEADLSLLICHWRLWQRFGAHTLTIAGKHRQDRTGRAVWSLAVLIPGVTQLFLQVCLQQLSPYGRLCNKHGGGGDGAKDAVEIAKSP